MADYGTSNQYIVLSLNSSESNVEIANNRSLLTVTLDIRRTNTGYSTYGSGTAYIRVNGSTYSRSLTSSDKITSTSMRLITQQIWIPHNSDGSKSVSVTCWISHSRVTSSEQGYAHTLTKIPRQATIGSLSGAKKLTDTYTYSYTPQTSSYYYKARISIPNVATIKTLTLGNKSTGAKSSTFSLAASDLTTVLNNITNTSSTVTIGVVVETYTSSAYSSKIGESSEAKLTVTIPTTITAGSTTVKDSNSTITNLTGNSAYIVQNKSNLTVVLGSATVSDCASTTKPATITKYEVTINGVTKTLTAAGTLNFGTISNSSNTTGTLKTYDSRGNNTSKTFTVNVIPYSKPIVKIDTCYRCNSNGVEDATNGTYIYVKVVFSISPVAIGTTAKNTVKSKSLTLDGASKSTTFTSNNGFTISNVSTNEHTIVVTVTDVFGEKDTHTYIVKSAIIPFVITKNKKSVGFGKVPDVDGEMQVDYILHLYNAIKINNVKQPVFTEVQEWTG